MTLKLGTLQADIDLDASGLKKAEDEVRKSTDKIENEFKGVDRAAAKTSNSMKGVRGAAGQLGFQVQDVAVQLQSGTNALVVLAQQGSQIAGIFGPTGAIVGGFIAVGAALGSVLVPSLFDASDASEHYDDVLDRLKDTVDETAGGVDILSEKILKMGELSAIAARAEIASSLNKLRGEVERADEAVDSLGETFLDGFFNVVKYDEAVLSIGRSVENDLVRSFGLAENEAKAFDRILKGFGSSQITATRDVIEFSDALNEWYLTLSDPDEDITKFRDGVSKIALDTSEAASKIEFLEFALKNLSKAIKDSENATSGLSNRAIERRIEEIRRLGETELEEAFRIEQERREFILAQMQLTEDEKNSLLASAANDRIATMEDIAQGEIRAEERKAREIQRIQSQSINAQVNAVNAAANAIRNISDASGEDTATKFAAVVQGVAATAAQIATLMSAQAASQAAGDPTALTLPQKIANVAAIAGIFGTIFSTINSVKGGGRQHGGNVSPSLAHPINEAGTPEILEQGGRQYLLPTGEGGSISPLKSGGSSGQAPNVTIISNGTPQTITSTSSSNGEIRVMINDAIRQNNQQIKSELSSGRGDFSNSLRRGHRVERNL